jgi:hypothetical protein
LIGLIGKQPRSCALYTVVSLLIGRESAVFRRFQGVRAHARTRFQDDFAVAEDLPDKDEPHLSFSLRFGQLEERDTLDICFDDGQEELFGLWVAAVRALVPAQALGPDLRKAAVGQPTAAPGDASSAPQLVRPQAMPPPQPFDDLFASLSPASSATVECKPPAEAAVQTHGGFGFAEEYDIERKFREARLYQVAPISTNLILSHLAEHVLGLPRSY